MIVALNFDDFGNHPFVALKEKGKTIAVAFKQDDLDQERKRIDVFSFRGKFGQVSLPHFEVSKCLLGYMGRILEKKFVPA